MRRDLHPVDLRMFNSSVGPSGIRKWCRRAPDTGLPWTGISMEIAMKESWQCRHEALQAGGIGLDAIAG